MLIQSRYCYIIFIICCLWYEDSKELINLFKFEITKNILTFSFLESIEISISLLRGLIFLKELIEMVFIKGQLNTLLGHIIVFKKIYQLTTSFTFLFLVIDRISNRSFIKGSFLWYKWRSGGIKSLLHFDGPIDVLEY